VINESGYKVGDSFPEIRGLMHIKNDSEQQVFKDNRSNILVALWSNQCKELNEFLEVVDNIAHQKKVKAAYAINIDRVFLYNQDIQKILIDKLKTVFLRDSQFANMNNLFSTRFVRNFHNAESTAPFIILTDENGKIAMSEPVDTKKLSQIVEAVDKVNSGISCTEEK